MSVTTWSSVISTAGGSSGPSPVSSSGPNPLSPSRRSRCSVLLGAVHFEAASPSPHRCRHPRCTPAIHIVDLIRDLLSHVVRSIGAITKPALANASRERTWPAPVPVWTDTRSPGTRPSLSKLRASRLVIVSSSAKVRLYPAGKHFPYMSLSASFPRSCALRAPALLLLPCVTSHPAQGSGHPARTCSWGVEAPPK